MSSPANWRSEGEPPGEIEEFWRELAGTRDTVRFDEYVAGCLYHPLVGFYSRSGRSGRDGDFLTSPEVGPLFGTLVARAVEAWWEQIGRPDPFAVVEVGAGRGTLAAEVLGEVGEACAEALRYRLVEVSAPQLEIARARLEGVRGVGFGSEWPPARRTVGPEAHVVIANELLDNLAFRVLQSTVDGWDELHVGMVDGELVEILLPVTGEVPFPRLPPGVRIPWQVEAATWVERTLAVEGLRRLVCFDYARTTAEMAPRRWWEWVRTYRGHRRGSHPLESPGRQDITCDVALDQLPGRPTVVTQAEFLREAGLDEITAEAERIWLEGAARGDLEALAARSSLSEARALTDPGGLGGFKVIQWVR